MPTDKEVAEAFKALVENGLSFIERSASELPTAPTFSIAHFATGLELLLKARLFAEHWTLVAEKPHKCSWSGLRSGHVYTLQASEICAAITMVTGTPLKPAQEVFGKVFRHRNQVLHWLPPGALGEVEAEQCLAWYRLHTLLTVRWKDQYEDFRTRVNEVERVLRRHRPYLQARYEALEPKLAGMSATGAIEKCPSCGFAAAAMESPIRTVAAFACEVCGADGHLAEFDCGHRLALDDLPATCPCGEEHTREQLFELLDANRYLSPKEASYAPEPPHCGECLDPECTVAELDGDSGYQCVACGAYFEAELHGSCEYCNTNWVGYDLDGSYLTGCEFCDGRLGRDD